MNGLRSGTCRRDGDEQEGRLNGRVRRNVEESAGIERAYIREEVTLKHLLQQDRNTVIPRLTSDPTNVFFG